MKEATEGEIKLHTEDDQCETVDTCSVCGGEVHYDAIEATKIAKTLSAGLWAEAKRLEAISHEFFDSAKPVFDGVWEIIEILRKASTDVGEQGVYLNQAAVEDEVEPGFLSAAWFEPKRSDMGRGEVQVLKDVSVTIDGDKVVVDKEYTTL